MFIYAVKTVFDGTSDEDKTYNMDQEINVSSLADATEITLREIIFYALCFRHLKRVSLHLRNISTSVLNPFDRIGCKPSIYLKYQGRVRHRTYFRSLLHHCEWLLYK